MNVKSVMDMEGESDEEISILIDYKIYLYLMLPIMEELLARGALLVIYASESVRRRIPESMLSNPKLRVVALEDLKHRRKLAKVLHRLLIGLLTPKDFSWQYMKKRSHIVRKSSLFNRVVFRLSCLLPTVEKSKVNSLVRRLMAWFWSSPVASKKIVVGSLNASPELLCDSSKSIFTVTESWDHSVKWPNGYVSAILFAWNKDLADDWRKTQGDVDCRGTYPLKLRYPLERIAKRPSRKMAIKRRKVCLYPLATTRGFSVDKWVGLEEKIIDGLCRATQRAGWALRLKPRPNGKLEDAAVFVDRYPHVSATNAICERGSVAADYFLSDEYNRKRFEELEDVDLVMNCWTTFGLDAASAGFPVLQFNVSAASGFEDSVQVFKNHHLKYLLERENVLNIKKDFESELIEFLEGDLASTERYSEDIRQWLNPGKQSSVESVRKIVDEVLIYGCS